MKPRTGHLRARVPQPPNLGMDLRVVPAQYDPDLAVVQLLVRRSGLEQESGEEVGQRLEEIVGEKTCWNVHCAFGGGLLA
jgi:hypothetical protein